MNWGNWVAGSRQQKRAFMPCLQTLSRSSETMSGVLSRKRGTETVSPETELFVLGVSQPFSLLSKHGRNAEDKTGKFQV